MTEKYFIRILIKVAGNVLKDLQNDVYEHGEKTFSYYIIEPVTKPLGKNLEISSIGYKAGYLDAIRDVVSMFSGYWHICNFDNETWWKNIDELQTFINELKKNNE